MINSAIPAAGDVRHSDTVPLEIERKFLILYPDESRIASFPGSRRVEIVQTYLSSPGPVSRRVRQWSECGQTLYYKTEKHTLTDRTREEREEEISQNEYLSLLREADPARGPVRKTRWRIPYAGHLLEVDLYPFWKDRAILECELQHEDEEFEIPDEFSVIKEVTGDPRYLNSSLARRLTNI